MPDEILIRHCSPTLAGIKTGSLFSCRYETREKLYAEVRRINQMLVPKGLSMLPLRFEGERVMMYLYRPSSLRLDLADAETQRILRDSGYVSLTAEKCLYELIRRLNRADGFPHEIGLFLSYPPEDVRQFIKTGGRGCKCVGCWKVYGDVEAAKRRFSQFERCTCIYQQAWNRGCSLEKLTVSDESCRCRS